MSRLVELRMAMAEIKTAGSVLEQSLRIVGARELYDSIHPMGQKNVDRFPPYCAARVGMAESTVLSRIKLVHALGRDRAEALLAEDAPFAHSLVDLKHYAQHGTPRPPKKTRRPREGNRVATGWRLSVGLSAAQVRDMPGGKKLLERSSIKQSVIDAFETACLDKGIAPPPLDAWPARVTRGTGGESWPSRPPIVLGMEKLNRPIRRLDRAGNLVDESGKTTMLLY